MKQYWIFILNCLCTVFFDAIDGSFGNSISIDAVVVMGSIMILSGFCKQFLAIGAQAYRVFQGYELNCCLMAVLSGIIVGVICVTCAYPISFIFELTDTQRQMLVQGLICYGLWCPAEGVGRFLREYISCKCYNKLIIIANISTFILLIATDWVAMKLNWGVNGLVCSTGFSWLAYAVVLIICVNFFKTKDKITKSALKVVFSKGKDVVLGGIVSRFANLCLGHFASTMGTAQYAIHSVALSVVQLAEEFRDAEANYVIVRLKNRKKTKWHKAKLLLKQCWVPALFIPIVASFGLTFIMHGKVDICDALYGVAIYCAPMLIYPVYDCVQQYVISSGRTKYTILNGCMCGLWRIGILWGISLFMSINTMVIGAIYFLDYLSRLILYCCLVHRDARRQE